MMKEKDGEYKYEYKHYDLGYGIHYGVHSCFGEHIAFGTGSNMVHIYPYKIFVGQDEGLAVPLSPEQRRVMTNVFKLLGRRVEGGAKVSTELTGALLPGMDTEKEKENGST